MKTYKELLERINMKKASMGEVIKDFQDSDAPQFQGKSQEKRRQMAIAAKMAAEEVELEEGRMKELVTKHMDAGHDYDAAMKKAKKDLEKMKTEELKGDQHKIDANKNGKIDGHDFKLLRAKKKVEEEAEQIDEISAATKASYVKKAAGEIDKLYDKSKTDARSAYKYYGRKNTMRKIANEEVEQIEEISAGLARRAADAAYDKSNAARKKTYPVLSNTEKKANIQGRKFDRYANKKEVGVRNEEVEQIDERSSEYSKKVGKNLTAAALDTGNVLTGGLLSKSKLARKAMKWADSPDETTSKSRLKAYQARQARKTNEEVEQIEELSKNTLKSYVNKSSQDAVARGISYGYSKDTKDAQNALKKLPNRVQGIKKATDKLAEEQIEESDLKPFIVVHAKHGKFETHAASTYEAAKNAAAHWKTKKGTAGMDVHRADITHSTQHVG